MGDRGARAGLHLLDSDGSGREGLGVVAAGGVCLTLGMQDKRRAAGGKASRRAIGRVAARAEEGGGALGQSSGMGSWMGGEGGGEKVGEGAMTMLRMRAQWRAREAKATFERPTCLPWGLGTATLPNHTHQRLLAPRRNPSGVFWSSPGTPSTLILARSFPLVGERAAHGLHVFTF